MILSVLAAVLTLSGALLFLVAGIGLVRLPDVFSRSSSVATAAGVGFTAILVGVWCQLPTGPNLVKVVVAIVLQLITSAVGSMALVRAGHLTGSTLARPDAVDELTAAAVSDGRRGGRTAQTSCRAGEDD